MDGFGQAEDCTATLKTMKILELIVADADCRWPETRQSFPRNATFQNYSYLNAIVGMHTLSKLLEHSSSQPATPSLCDIPLIGPYLLLE
jgi:hypothetical protein